jgi:hypothetical protein
LGRPLARFVFVSLTRFARFLGLAGLADFLRFLGFAGWTGFVSFTGIPVRFAVAAVIVGFAARVGRTALPLSSGFLASRWLL